MPQHLLFAFLASSVRYSEDPYYADKVGAISAYAVQAWKAMVMPWNGIETDISIVQTILLLAIIDYTGKSASWDFLHELVEAEISKMARHRAPG